MVSMSVENRIAPCMSTRFSNSDHARPETLRFFQNRSLRPVLSTSIPSMASARTTVPTTSQRHSLGTMKEKAMQPLSRYTAPPPVFLLITGMPSRSAAARLTSTAASWLSPMDTQGLFTRVEI
jgi:hypothetical protein